MTTTMYKHRTAIAAVLGLLLAAGAPALAALPSGAGNGHDAMPVTSTAGGSGMLIEALKAKRLDIVTLLVKNGVDVNASSAGEGTALIYAAKIGNAAMVGELIKLGADVNLATPGDGSPLIAAAQSGDLGVARQLLSAGARTDLVVPGDETALINAARSGRFEMVKLLVASGADVNLGARDDSGAAKVLTPLNQAASSEIKQFLTGKGALR